MTPPIKMPPEEILDEEEGIKPAQVQIETLGSLMNHDGNILLAKAMLQNEKSGRAYILMSPDLPSIIARGESFLRIDFGSLSSTPVKNKVQNSFQKAQKILFRDGGMIIHLPGGQSLIDDIHIKGVSGQLSEVALILKTLGFPKGYIFLLTKRISAEVDILSAAGFVIKQYGHYVRN